MSLSSLARSLALLLLYTSSLLSSLSAKHSTLSRHSHHTHHRHHNSTTTVPNDRLKQAYVALQAWKRVIYSDPSNLTTDWTGSDVCSYTGIYCAPALDDPHILVVAGIDLNHGDIASFLPDEIGLLSDLSLLHLNSNRFCGILPLTMANLTLLYELDLSNNRFVGPFPNVVLALPSLKFLDLRYNEFEGALPPHLFNRNFDAIFINSNRLTSVIPSNLSFSSASVIVFANNKLGGCLPPTIAKFAESMEELLLINTSLTGCLPEEVGFLYKLRVLDASNNQLVGHMPYSIAGLDHLEQLNLAHNMMSGDVHLGVCLLPSLKNFTFSYNFFEEEEDICSNLTLRGVIYDDRRNCLPGKPYQRSQKECEPVLQHPVDCFELPCEANGTSQTGVSLASEWPHLSHP